jgi:hypothetical protein
MPGDARKNVSGEGEQESDKKIDPRIAKRIEELRARAKVHLSQQEFQEALSCLDLAIDLNSSSYKVSNVAGSAAVCRRLHAHNPPSGLQCLAMCLPACSSTV